VKTVIRIFLFLLVSLFVSTVVLAQDMPSLRKQAEETVKAKDPAWKLIRKEEKNKEVTYLWGSEKTDVRITIFYGDSEQEAVNRMSTALKFLSVGPGKKLTSLGDEA
jgi:hypothetical protein